MHCGFKLSYKLACPVCDDLDATCREPEQMQQRPKPPRVVRLGHAVNTVYCLSMLFRQDLCCTVSTSHALSVPSHC